MGLTRFTQNGQIINLRDNRLSIECARIHAQLSQAIERLIIIGMKVETVDNLSSRTLVEQYNLSVWPNLADSHGCLAQLSASIRCSIDECQVSDSRLSKLLELNKFQLEAREITDELIEKIGKEMELALEVKQRAKSVQGVRIDPDKMGQLQDYKHRFNKWNF